MASVETEQVLVVPTAEFKRLGYFQGVSTEVDRYLPELLNKQFVSYRPRDEMELDPSFKQLIPYVIFQHDDADGERWLFAYTRGSGQGESRLHAKISIGVGGHISLEDAVSAEDAVSLADAGQPAANPYHAGMRRELEEEVVIRTAYADRLVGLINDDETEVGKVHLGIVHVFSVETPDVAPREDEILQAGFQSLTQLRADRDRMESWSRICLDAIYGT